MRRLLAIILLFLLIPLATAVQIDHALAERINAGEKVAVIITTAPQPEARAMRAFSQQTPQRIAKELTKADLAQLQEERASITIKEDRKVQATLDQSVPLINATNVWNLTYNGEAITGEGQSVCVIDSGLDYHHAGLGDCTGYQATLDGATEAYSLSSGSYPNDANITWNITQTGYASIAAHFQSIDIEERWDRLEVRDQGNTLIATYKGSISDVWTPSATGETLYFTIISDSSVTGNGFIIDDVINGTVTNTMDWSDCQVIAARDVLNDDDDPYDTSDHATHVAGIITSQDETYKGVAPGAKIVMVKALDKDGNGFMSDIIKGIEWCTNHQEEYNISAISMSLGDDYNHSTACDGQGAYADIEAAVAAATAANIAVIAASGNNGNKEGIAGPACLSDITSVGSVTKTDLTTSYSQASPILDLLAPGNQIISLRPTVLGGGFVSMSGTSMATPHVAATYALLAQFGKAERNETLSRNDLLAALTSTGKAINDSGHVTPRIDVYAAIQALDNHQPLITYTNETPSNNTSTQEQNITFAITASEQLQEANLTIDNETIPMQGAGMDWSVNQTFNTTGTITYRVTATDLAGNIGEAATRTLTITSNPSYFTNTTPANTSIILAEPASQNFTINYTDDDNDTITIHWYLDQAMQAENTTNYMLNGNYQLAGTHNVTVTISDNHSSTSHSWNVTYNNTDTQPQINNVSMNETNLTVAEQDLLAITANVSDEDGDTLTTTWQLDNETISNENSLNYTIPYNTIGNYTLTFTITDPQNNTANRTWQLTITYTHTSPVLDHDIPDATWQENTDLDDELDLDDYFSDVHGETLNYSVSGNHHITITIDDGVVSYTPEEDWTGTETVRFAATNNHNTTTSNSVTLEVERKRTSSGGGSTSTPTVQEEEPSDEFSKTVTLSTDQETTIAIAKADLPLTSLQLHASSDIAHATFQAKKLNARPAGTKSHTYKVNAYLEITKDTNETIEATIGFSVAKAWLQTTQVEPRDIILLRYTNDWQALPTEQTGENDTHVFYEATTPGFSYFAIAEREQAEAQPAPVAAATTSENGTANATQSEHTKTPTEEAPANAEPTEKRSTGLPIAIGITAIILLATIILFSKHRRQKNI